MSLGIERSQKHGNIFKDMQKTSDTPNNAQYVYNSDYYPINVDTVGSWAYLIASRPGIGKPAVNYTIQADGQGRLQCTPDLNSPYAPFYITFPATPSTPPAVCYQPYRMRLWNSNATNPIRNITIVPVGEENYIQEPFNPDYHSNGPCTSRSWLGKR
eukprot:TRINITY_DN14754_c1_g1_i1.p1 TRINITY_DN14754_c1_g1~~TRINITY_DN14754_c1_g1_i1.p1  ORF type:complete len:166 (+),score=27.66 TRINITY_DN14754_c1_g1_i1:28-498(+)